MHACYALVDIDSSEKKVISRGLNWSDMFVIDRSIVYLDFNVARYAARKLLSTTNVLQGWFRGTCEGYFAQEMAQSPDGSDSPIRCKIGRFRLMVNSFASV